MADSRILVLKLICALFFVLAFSIPPDGVDGALTCFRCKKDGNASLSVIPPGCDEKDKANTINCTTEKEQCYTKTMDKVVTQRGCADPGTAKLTEGCITHPKSTENSTARPDTVGTVGTVIKFCYCKTDKCTGPAPETPDGSPGLAGYIRGWSPGHILVISFLLVIITPRVSNQ